VGVASRVQNVLDATALAKYRVLIAINSSARAKIKVECGGARNAAEIRMDIRLEAFI
jgi:hypothetical protein